MKENERTNIPNKNIAIITDAVKYQYPEMNVFIKEKIFSDTSPYPELKEKLLSTIISWYNYTYEDIIEEVELYHIFLFLYDSYSKEMIVSSTGNETDNINNYLKKVITKIKYVKKRNGEINRQEYHQIAPHISNGTISPFSGMEKNKLYKFAVSYIAIQEQVKNNKERIYNNIIECISDIYTQIELWHLNKDTFLTEYNFFNTCTLKKQYEYLLIDLKLCLFETIKNIFSSDINKTMMSIPKDISTHPYFHFQNNTSIDIISEAILIGSEQSEPKEVYKGIEHINEFASVALSDADKPDVKIVSSPLNSIDWSIYISVYNKITLATFKNPFIYCSLPDICYEIFGNQPDYTKRKSYYLKTTYNSIKKLLSYKLKLEGSHDSKTHLLYVDMLGELSEIITDEKTQKDTLKYYENINFKLAVPLSMLQIWETQKNDIIMTKVYNQLQTSQAKALFCFIQTIRIKQYAQEEEKTDRHYIIIYVNDIKQRFNFSQIKPNRMIAIINSELEKLKESNVGILNYEYNSELKRYIIEMPPFSEIEKKIYNISTVKKLEVANDYQYSLFDIIK